MKKMITNISGYFMVTFKFYIILNKRQIA